MTEVISTLIALYLGRVINWSELTIESLSKETKLHACKSLKRANDQNCTCCQNNNYVKHLFNQSIFKIITILQYNVMITYVVRNSAYIKTL